MRSVDKFVRMRAAAAPLAAVYGSTLKKVPEWLGGMIGSSRGGAFPPGKKPETASEPETEILEELLEMTPPSSFDPSGDPQALVDDMLSQQRYALLLRPQLIENLSAAQLARARTALSEGMCLVPAGEVAVRRTTSLPEADPPLQQEFPFRVEAYYLDRYPVTNAQYFQFVRHGGYEQMAIWDAEVLPAVLDFVDQTGHVGPRFWRNGRYPRGEDHFPVVGVCWYEAAAFSRWSGKRLPTDAEWVKAASWPVAIAGHPLLQRRYPWGEAVDRGRANLWGSGPGRTVAVDEFPGGVSVGGAQQLIGNVWEWTVDPLVLDDDPDLADDSPLKMKSLRGGAFDTYLDSQATCQFQSGDDVLARKHNVGFRAAISVYDLSNFGGADETPDAVESSLLETQA